MHGTTVSSKNNSNFLRTFLIKVVSCYEKSQNVNISINTCSIYIYIPRNTYVTRIIIISTCTHTHTHTHTATLVSLVMLEVVSSWPRPLSHQQWETSGEWCGSRGRSLWSSWQQKRRRGGGRRVKVQVRRTRWSLEEAGQKVSIVRPGRVHPSEICCDKNLIIY